MRICVLHAHADARERGRRACMGRMKIGSLLEVKCIKTMRLMCSSGVAIRNWGVSVPGRSPNIQCKRRCKSVPKIVYAIRRFPLLGGVAMRGSTVLHIQIIIIITITQ